MVKENSPATTSMAYDHMLPSWAKIQTVLDGTDALRKAGSLYLPQHKYESNEAYGERLAKSVLINMTKLTLQSWVGRPFSIPIKLVDVPPQIQELLTDVDMLGSDLQMFARNWFGDGVAKAFSHVYVDFPRTDLTPERTLATDREERIRPYWVHWRPEQLFFASSEMDRGQEVLTEVRVMENLVVREGFAEKCVQQIRRVTLDGQRVELYQLQRIRNSKKEAWVLVDSYTFSLPTIPLVTFYSDREAFMQGTPPLEDLADLNLSHWQGYSDQQACLTVARFPILALSGGSDTEGALKIGPNRWLYSPDPAAKFYYVEHSGNAIEAGRKDLLDKEARMSEYGAEFLKKRPSATTATARTLDSSEATSPLQDMAMRFATAMNQALALTAQWMALPSGGTAQLRTDFGPEDSSPAELTTLQATRKDRDISRVTYLKEIQRRGLLPDDFNQEADAKLLEEESLEMIGTLTPTPPEVKPEPEPEEE